jgi:outer membrane protein OmpA-like peptidoglycan-associated protein
VRFIADRNATVNDTTWFEFDRLTFETGSATLRPESRDQLQNVASILKAYPDVHVRIGGYTDSIGDASANMRLSQDRADAVRRELEVQGISPTRLAAEGYGSQHPVADNATEEGRAKNRRIAVRVTQK